MGGVGKEIRLNVSMTSVSPAALTSVPKEKFSLSEKKVCWLAALNASYKFAQPASKLYFFFFGEARNLSALRRPDVNGILRKFKKHPSGLSGETVQRMTPAQKPN